MGPNPPQKQQQPNNNSHPIRIWEANKDLLGTMYQIMSEPPRLLSNAAGKPSCCIFRVPQSLVEINGKSYNPHIVSIGPYHRGETRLKMIEEHKWKYLGSLLARTEPKGLTLRDYLKALEPLEQKARECYSESINLSTDEFLEMLVLDGCFIIELFRKFGLLVRDFLRLENQMPYFVLLTLFDLTTMEEHKENGKSLSLLALEFFNNHMQRPDHLLPFFGKNTNIRNNIFLIYFYIDFLRYMNFLTLYMLTSMFYTLFEGMHLLDLLRSSVIPPGHEEPRSSNTIPTHTIHCVSKLRRAGIKLNPGKDESFLVIKFKSGVIEMPPITIDDFMSSSKHITTYATLLDCLVNTYKDVEYLSDRDIIENCFGNDGEVARFINNLGKDVAFDMDRCYLAKLFNDVHHYYGNTWHVQWASFKYTYFDTPWSFISAFAALILLILTFMQTFYTVLSYYHP
ncbi:unnamed protein product [Malus baccata var. baccata]